MIKSHLFKFEYNDENIKVTDEGAVKFLEFFIAMFADLNKEFHENLTSVLMNKSRHFGGIFHFYKEQRYLSENSNVSSGSLI
jgi:hypothetical protein